LNFLRVVNDGSQFQAQAAVMGGGKGRSLEPLTSVHFEDDFDENSEDDDSQEAKNLRQEMAVMQERIDKLVEEKQEAERSFQALLKRVEIQEQAQKEMEQNLGVLLKRVEAHAQEKAEHKHQPAQEHAQEKVEHKHTWDYEQLSKLSKMLKTATLDKDWREDILQIIQHYLQDNKFSLIKHSKDPLVKAFQANAERYLQSAIAAHQYCSNRRALEAARFGLDSLLRLRL
jgi:hypothetical protein